MYDEGGKIIQTCYNNTLNLIQTLISQEKSCKLIDIIFLKSLLTFFRY